ncbi:DinB family protein [Pedobacter immunditicola]|uniref:DinB family protein n=1 Tax=Pedobacter immunditicola TaxID=3133440 RepID=UPI0030A1CC78
MKTTELIAQHILEVHEGNNWTESAIAGALADVTVNDATRQTAASPNTIASLLHHITFWNRLMVQRINGIDVPETESNGYDVPPLHTEEEWQVLKADNINSAHELAAAIRAFDENRLQQPILPGYSTAYKNLQGTSEHIHYHLGQMVILKQLIHAEK